MSLDLDEAVFVCAHWSRAASRLSEPKLLRERNVRRALALAGIPSPRLPKNASRTAVVRPQAKLSSSDEKVRLERNERAAVQVFSNRVILSLTPRAPLGGAGRVGRERFSMRRGLAGWLGFRRDAASRGGKFRWHCATSCPAQRASQRASQRTIQMANQPVEETFSSAITNCFRANPLTAQLTERATRSPEQERRRFQ
jgi:hypothetical protein